MSKQGVKTKEQIAYDHLKKLIIKGELPKNKFLSQRMLAEKVNTNLSTMRTVLRQLESDHLMENVPKWGVRIPIDTEDSVRDRYYMRELLETGAVKLIIQKLNSGEVDTDKLIEKARICDTLIKETREIPKDAKDVDKFAKAHQDFHIELAKQSGSPLLLENLSRIHFQSLMFKNGISGWTHGSATDHISLVDIILHDKEETAVNFIIKHIKGGLTNELRNLYLEQSQYDSQED